MKKPAGKELAVLIATAVNEMLFDIQSEAGQIQTMNFQMNGDVNAIVLTVTFTDGLKFDLDGKMMDVRL